MLAKNNTVNLIGYLGIDPIVRNFGNNKTVAHFSIATKEVFRNQSGEWEKNITWHRVVAWGQTAENCGKYLKKGTKISLEGMIVHNDTSKKDGVKRNKTEIKLRRFTPLDSIMN